MTCPACHSPLTTAPIPPEPDCGIAGGESTWCPECGVEAGWVSERDRRAEEVETRVQESIGN